MKAAATSCGAFLRLPGRSLTGLAISVYEHGGAGDSASGLGYSSSKARSGSSRTQSSST